MAEEKKAGDVYVCEICGQEVSIVTPSGSPLVCCGEEMVLKSE